MGSNIATVEEEINEALTIIVEDMINPSGPEIDCVARALVENWKAVKLTFSYDPETQHITVTETK